MSDIRWTDKIWLDSDGNLQSFEGPIHLDSTDYTEKIVKDINNDIDNKLIMEISQKLQIDIDKPRLMAALNNDKEYYQKYWSEGFDAGRKSLDVLDDYLKLNKDMKLIKDAINDPNKNGFDICRLIKSVTDEYDFEEEKDEQTTN
jgi:hypothetical protein